MIILGLAGKAGVGKNEVARYLVERYGFIEFSFSDALYREVEVAFGLGDALILRDRATKEIPTALLCGENCDDSAFIDVLMANGVASGDEPLSPRVVLQLWGTQYRRAQDSEYWIKRAEEWVHAVRSAMPYPEQAPQYFVNTSVRFPNERAWVHAMGGNVWHLRRAGLAAVNAHVSEEPLEVWDGERELHNNDTVERLHRCGVELLLTMNARFVKVEPMLPDVDPTADTAPPGAPAVTSPEQS